MEWPNDKERSGQQEDEIKTYPVPFDLDGANENLTFTTNTPLKPSKEQVIQQALNFHGQGDISKAIKYYQNCINLGFIDHRVFSNYGTILKDLGKLNEAEINLKKAIDLNQSNPNDYKNLGSILLQLNQFEEAEILTRKAIEIKPDFPEAYSNLGIILMKLGQNAKAKISIQKAIEINPKFVEAYINLGILLVKLGELLEAKEVTQKGIEINPQIPIMHSNLANIFKELGLLEEAEKSIRKAISIKTDFVEAYDTLGKILLELGQLNEAEESICKAIKINPNYTDAYWDLSCLSNNIQEAEERIKKCLKIDSNYLNAKLMISVLRAHQGNKSSFNNFLLSKYKDHHLIRSCKWVLTLKNLPNIFFHRWAFFDSMIQLCNKDRPFYEFGVWRGVSFKYLINTLKKGYGFDTFQGLPEDWHNEKKGTYSAEGIIPKIEGGVFIEGKFEDTLPAFFSEDREMASIINFDADLYSSTICALNSSKPVIDESTILIFDEFIMYENWEEDEYKALKEFCSINNLSYEVIAVSYFSKQVAVKLLGL